MTGENDKRGNGKMTGEVKDFVELKKAIFDYCIARHIPPAHIVAYVFMFEASVKELRDASQKCDETILDRKGEEQIACQKCIFNKYEDCVDTTKLLGRIIGDSDIVLNSSTVKQSNRSTHRQKKEVKHGGTKRRKGEVARKD